MPNHLPVLFLRKFANRNEIGERQQIVRFYGFRRRAKLFWRSQTSLSDPRHGNLISSPPLSSRQRNFLLQTHSGLGQPPKSPWALNSIRSALLNRAVVGGGSLVISPTPKVATIRTFPTGHRHSQRGCYQLASSASRSTLRLLQSGDQSRYMFLPKHRTSASLESGNVIGG